MASPTGRARLAALVGTVAVTAVALWWHHRLRARLVWLLLSSRNLPGGADAALRAAEEAVALAEEVHGPQSMECVPALRCRAAAMLRAGRPISEAGLDLGRVRQISRACCGENSRASAEASFELARCLVRGGVEEVAGDWTLTLLDHACALALEACNLASVASRPADAARYAATLLEALAGAKGAAAVRAEAQLRDAYLEAAGVEWNPAK